jgi:hypothetical protein
MGEVMTLNMTADQLASIRLLANAPHLHAIAIDCYAIPPETMAVLREVLDANGIDDSWPVQYRRRQERKRS